MKIICNPNFQSLVILIRRVYTWESDNGILTAVGQHKHIVRNVTSNIEDLFNRMNPTQCIKSPNSYGIFLDLCFSDLEFVPTYIAIDPMCKKDNYHQPYIISCNLHKADILETVVERIDYRNAIYITINKELANIDWDYLLEFSNINYMIQSFYEKLFHVITLHTKKYIASDKNKKQRYPAWFDKDIINEIRKKKFLHYFYKVNPTLHNYDEFSKQRTKCKKLTKAAHEKFIRNGG